MSVIETLNLAIQTLEKCKRQHYYCEDTWYCCPMHPEYSGMLEQGSVCECGADEINTKINETLDVIHKQIAELER